MITREQAHMIAVLVQTIRTAWDTRAIAAVITELARYDIADLTHAAIRAAQDPTMRQPTSIGFLDANHWRPTIREVESDADRAERKRQQLTEREALHRDRDRIPDPTPYVDRIRAEIRPCKAPDLRPTQDN